MEVLIAIGLFAILAVGIATFITNGMKQQKGIQAKDQQRDMSAKIRSLLNDKAACKSSFGAVTPVAGDPPTAPTVPSINDKLGTAIFSLGDTDQTKLLRIEKIRLSNWVPEPGNPTQGSVDLLIDFSKTGETGTAKYIAPDTITLRAKRILGGNITECFSIGVQSGGFWQASPADTSNIYYAGGKVGIGTDTPLVQFEVSKENDYSVMLASTYINGGISHPVFIGLTARGTKAAPTHPLNGDVLSSYVGRDAINGLTTAINDYGGSGIYMHATEDASPTNKGSNIKFITTSNGTNVAMDRVIIDPSGNVGIGTMTPTSSLEVRESLLIKNTSNPGVGFFAWGKNPTNGSLTDFMFDGGNDAVSRFLNVGTAAGGFTAYGSMNPDGSSLRDTLVVMNSGNVGIGNTAPSKLLHVGSASVGTGLAVANFQNVDGTCTITPASSGSGIACSSDERLKENFQDVSSSFALDRILQLQAVTYNFKTSSDDNRRTGYKAQEVQKVAPEFVRENEDGLLQVYYDAFIPWITEAIKTLYSRITGVENHQAIYDREIASVKAQKADKAEVDQLKTENAKLKTEAEKQKQENAAMKARVDKIEKMLKSK